MESRLRNLFEQGEARLAAGDVVQGSEGQQAVKLSLRQGFCPAGVAEVSLNILHFQPGYGQVGGDGAAGFVQQHRAEVEAGVTASAFLADPFQAECAAAAAEVEPAAMRGDGFGQQAVDAGLDTAAGMGERISEGLVELSVKSKQLLAGFGLHGLIIPAVIRMINKHFCSKTVDQLMLCRDNH